MNKLDSLIYQADNMIKDDEKNIANETADALNDATETAKIAIDSDDLEQIESAYSDLENILHLVAKEMYQQNTESVNVGESPIDVDFTTESDRPTV